MNEGRVIGIFTSKDVMTHFLFEGHSVHVVQELDDIVTLAVDDCCVNVDLEAKHIFMTSDKTDYSADFLDITQVNGLPEFKDIWVTRSCRNLWIALYDEGENE